MRDFVAFQHQSDWIRRQWEEKKQKKKNKQVYDSIVTWNDTNSIILRRFFFYYVFKITSRNLELKLWLVSKLCLIKTY